MSVSQATIQKKSQVRLERGPAWHRATTRKAILDAAREMIEQDGLEKTSLLRIAEKTGFAPPTVYAYFVRKSDLISAIVADDLSSFARTIRDGFPFSPEPELPEEDVAASEAGSVSEHAQIGYDAEDVGPIEHEPQAFEAVQVQAPVVAQVHAEDEDAAAAAPVEAAPGNGDTGLISTIESRIAQLEARRVDPWLERRLREFERMLSTLDERVGGSAAPADGNADNRLQQIVERLEAFEKKQAAAVEEKAKALADTIEAREAKLRQTQAELRTLTLEASGRLEVLERDREMRAMATEMPAVDFMRRAPEPVPAEEPSPETPAADDQEDAASRSDESYLAAARRAALTAQSLAKAEERSFAEEVSAWAAPVKARSRLLVAVCVALGVVLLGAEFLLSHHAAMAPAAHPPMTQAAKLLVPAAKGPRTLDFAGVNAAAQSGSSRAQLELGLAYLNGAGVTEDDARAAHWLESSATAGDAVAQYWLATLFEHGKGERPDAAEAMRWYEASALQGNLKAMYKLAVSYAEGWGTRQNYGEAARWFSRAAEYGFVNAQFNLGVLYERGYGVPQSLLDSYKWYALAAAQGDKDSAARVDALSSQLSADDLATAKDAVAAFKPLTLNPEANVAPVLPEAKPHAADTGAQAPKG
ncbi:MAG TPA: TetR family transcriptional regulator [Rhizomicrobium sp.]|nr:TetR family transcriptional regulator [Rhizomicrobium sp.]